MVTHLTNNETYFFREMPQLQVFADHVLKSSRSARRGRRARRCASCRRAAPPAKRPTLAMIVYDSGQFFWNWDVQIIGLDVDQRPWTRRGGASTTTTPSAP